MEIRTGYFSKSRHYESLGYTCYGIVASVPKGFVGTNIKLVAPSWDIVSAYKKGEIDEVTYSERYLSHLDNINLTPLISSLQKLDKVVLMCYESPEKFCHRHELAKHLNIKYGLHVTELYV